ncbi:hypothetical protein PhCBS80983_g03709 [Powellomyces hirtus]|uniref:Reverse transcriptase domain-containing protein n=1 Tax=Powellomyces hirtus TaxID=109895 RepID=A0A507E1F7_9FUNG|nr:hypothetical protein PhCBS80983_g03709 [Powellomyces hirtus]
MMKFHHAGQTLSQPLSQANQSPLASTISPWRPALNADGIYTAKQWKCLMKKGEITGVFELHLLDVIPAIKTQFVQTVDAKKRAILEQQIKRTGPLAALAADHLPCPSLEKYITTLFTKQSGMPPDWGEDNFTIRLKPGSKPVMQPFRLPVGPPVLFAPEKDSGLRCCIGYRALNKMIQKDATPVPKLSELCNRLVNMWIFTAIDIRDNVLGFGLTDAPATFQQLSNKLLGKKYNAYVISYLNDILIFSTNMNSHIQHVDKVLKTLTEHCLHIKASKYQMAVDKVKFCNL